MDGVSHRVRRAREAAGLSIRELAGRAGVAASTVWRVESGRLDPTVSMLERLLEASASIGPVVRTTREAAVSLALGRLVASEVLRNPTPHVERARSRVAAILESQASPQGQRLWATEWQRVLDGPLEGVVAALIDPSERGYELRQNMPFTGLVADEERLEAVRRASREHRAARSA